MIFVTGASGFVGQSVVQALRKAGYRVRLLVRQAERARQLFPDPEVELVVGDLRDPSSLDSALSGVLAVVHLVGIISERSQASFEQIHVQGTSQLIAAMKRAQVDRLVHMSALGARAHARSRYHQSKWQAEELVRSSGLAWTIFRPSIIVGAGDHFLNFFARLVQPPVDFLQLYTMPLLGGGENRLQPIAVEDVAQAFTLSLADQRAVGQTYDLVGPDAYTFRSLMEKIVVREGHQPAFDPYGLGTLARHALWAATFYSILIFLCLTFLNYGPWEIRAVLLALSLLGSSMAVRWRTIYLYPIPLPVLQAMGWVLDRVLPDFFRNVLEKITGGPVPSEAQMQMLEEDNIGNPEPAASLFRLSQQPLDAVLSAAD